MSTPPPELRDLLDAVFTLSSVQARFDALQRAAFTERPPEFFALELCGEAGELANLEKKAWKGREVALDAFAEEAADVFIALMNYCNARGVPLAEAVQRKIEEIERRRVAGTH